MCDFDGNILSIVLDWFRASANQRRSLASRVFRSGCDSQTRCMRPNFIFVYFIYLIWDIRLIRIGSRFNDTVAQKAKKLKTYIITHYVVPGTASKLEAKFKISEGRICTEEWAANYGLASKILLQAFMTALWNEGKFLSKSIIPSQCKRRMLTTSENVEGTVLWQTAWLIIS